MTPDRLVPPTIRRWFASPEFIDEDEARTASLLMTILRIVSAALVLYGLLALLSGYLPGLIAVSAGTVIVLLVVALVRRGHAHTAVLMYACTSWALLTASTFAFGGRHGTPFVVLLLMTLVTSILLKNGARLLVIALTFGSSVVIFAAESAGSLPTGLYPPLSLSLFDAAARVVTFLMAALLLHLIAHSLNDALQRVRSSEQAVRAMYADLVSTTISQTYLDSILRSINDALIVLGPDMRIERVNRATLDLLGFTEAELIGQTPEPIFTPDALDWLMRTIQDSPARTIQTTFFTHDGQEIPVSFSASPFFDQRGATQGVGVVCVAQDMAERQQAARELAQREKLYRTLARSLPDMGVLLFDHDLRFMVAEGQALLAAGYVAEQMEGRILTDIMDAERVERLEPFYRQALAGEHVSFEWPNDDRTYFVQALPVRNETGDIFAGMLLIQDITRIKATEHELKQHIEQLTILRRVHDEVNRRLDVSYVLRLALDMAVRISLARAGAVLLLNDDQTIAVAEVIGSFSDNLLDGYPRPPDGVLAQALQSGHAHNLSPPVAIPLISNQRPIGVLLLETAAPLTPDNLDFMQVLAARVAVAVDNARLYQISQQQLAELHQLYERVSELEQLKTDMIRIAAHDLRNPLGVISGFAELMLDSGNLPAREYAQAKNIFTAAQRMQRMVSDILSLQRIEQLHSGSIHETIDLTALVDQVFRAHAEAARELDYQCSLPERPVFIKGDPPQIQEAITNLLTNAIKYTPAGGSVQVCLSADAVSAALEVVDTGYGIPDEMQSRLFQPFYRARSRETRDIEGTGLGLHLVKNIIERHNGRLYIHSVYGQGSTFGFRLPLATDASVDNTTEAVHEPAGET